MLKMNGGYLSSQLRTFSSVNGTYGMSPSLSLAPAYRMIGNRVCFGRDASWPYGYNSVTAIILPMRTGGFIAAIMRSDSTTTASVSAIGKLSADISGESTLTAGANSAVNRTASLAGSSTFTIEPSAKGWVSAAINAGATPSAYDIAQEIWQSQATAYNTPGTMGAKLNAAGSAGDPWATVIEGGYTAGEILRIITSALAGETSGMGTSTVSFTGIDGTTIRITGTMDVNNNRSGIVLDGN